jgi:RimJ/RimL family protein N-acetyltransferase
LIQQIETLEYHRAAPIFETLSIHLAARAVLHGAAGGRVWVDDPHPPRSGLLQTGHRFHLAGEPANPAFIRGLHTVFNQEIIPQARQRGDQGFMLYCDSPEWERVLTAEVLDGCRLYPGAREYLELDLRLLEPAALEIPAGYRFTPVTRALVESADIYRPDDFIEDLLSERQSLDDFLENSFGACLLHGQQVVCWCLSEYNLEDRCETGIGTAPEHRRRGLAALAGALFSAQARDAGITRIGWHCWSQNQASAAAARRIGFQPVCQYTGIFVSIDPA